MHIVLRTIILIATMLITPAVIAASGANLQIGGTLRAPPCLLTLANGGQIDFGVIPHSRLDLVNGTRLQTRFIALSITCGRPMRTSIRTYDNYADGRMAEWKTTFPEMVFGLGKVANLRVGSYYLWLPSDKIRADGAVADTLYSDDRDQTWHPGNGSGSLFFHGGRSLSWTTVGGTTPAAYKTITGTLQIDTTVRSRSNLPLKNDVPIRGGATFELTYL